MKAEIYNALAGLNRSFDASLEALKTLQEEGVLTADYVQDNSVLLEELRAGINHMIVEKLAARETDDWAPLRQNAQRHRKTAESRIAGLAAD